MATKITSIARDDLKRIRKAVRANETTPRRPKLDRGNHSSSILLPLMVKLTEDIARGESGIANIIDVDGNEIEDEDQQLTVHNKYKHKLWENSRCWVMPVQGVLSIFMTDAASRIRGAVINANITGVGTTWTIGELVGIDGIARPGGSSLTITNPHGFTFTIVDKVRVEWCEEAGTPAWEIYQGDC